MLPWELARFKIQGSRIIPLFIDNSEIAQEVLDLFQKGERLGNVIEQAKYLEKIYDYKLVRGLIRLIIRVTSLEEDSPIDPSILRRELFSRGPVFDKKVKEDVIEEIKKKYNIEPIRYMFSDLDEEKRIIEKPNISADELIKWYNLSLLQTLLFKGYRLSIRVSSNWKEIIWRAKLLGLMYYAYKEPLELEFIGPATLVKMNEKYGRNFAVLLPYVVSSPDWSIRAEIVLGKLKKRIYKLEASNLKNLREIKIDEKKFDSSIEEKFYNDFTSILKDWKITREPEPLVVKDKIFLPDFVAEKGKLKVYIEIVGFWTKKYLQNKLEKVSDVENPLLLLVNEELSIDGKIDLPNIILYKKKIDVMKVYKWLRDYERQFLQSLPNNIDYTIEGDVVSVSEIANRLSLPLEHLRKNLKNFPGYILLKNYYVKEDLINKIKSYQLEGRKLSDLKKEYGDYIVDVIDYLGYKLMWRGLTDAVVVKK
ncbi:DUF790 family protein [Sulfolobus acidocaldarius]|uniref:Conserved Archaeal protein n=4 Tax=Sulfolobus acidocaldarius TaxID=2285 RepID=Q4J8B4_SULAC|nr:DUF790 family protein [Sulfolobus acidocaldarius]AAY80966.1 conserved Archaeal protein [Sulfolobus acidocaldarius DSM 639]AGE71567.1 putative nuclease of restriction endonuclease-like fold protein [Sulfolobus acidocaldarius N8]AGE73840.1 putative nuclease of restriction endonuclease-like fold protein [Sulfolobus acidocaldarius Ron12/I]ALU30206.1 hypothetical protein ATY89_09840 [Sulfolobus acidocaldarius]ALU30921.1 hypothetical protein ATZ20_01395 [Sulfolobus acidocaldarius]